MSGKEWYKRLLNRKILQFYNETTKNWEQKITKIEYIMPHINHTNKYNNLKTLGLVQK